MRNPRLEIEDGLYRVMSLIQSGGDTETGIYRGPYTGRSPAIPGEDNQVDREVE